MESFSEVLSPRQKIKVLQQTWLEHHQHIIVLLKAGQVTARVRKYMEVPGARTQAEAIQSQSLQITSSNYP